MVKWHEVNPRAIKGNGLVWIWFFMDTLNNVILHTCERKLKNITSQFLTTLEARIIYIKRLEQTLTKMGIGDYENSIIDYQRDRKYFLDALGTAVRELQDVENIINSNKS